ncbi:MAG: efflux RND transporter permease subunit, partial [Myxococcales bacterium]|nr:efflux RND transporter permease subunit [Myxococcales bacterium]
MIERLLRLSLRHRALTLGAAAALLAAGLYRTAQMPVDVFPDLTAPRVTVVTEVSGMAAEEVEQLVTFPIETAVSGSAGLRRVRSASAPGISIVWAEFDWSASQAEARQRIMERLQSALDTLPPAASAPLLAPASSVMGEIAFVALTSDSLDPIELRRVAEVEVRRRVLALDGVSQAVAIGGQIKQYQAILDPHRLQHHGLGVTEVVEAVRRGSLNAAGGYVVDGGQEAVVRILGRADSLEELAAIVVAGRGNPAVRLRDVADVGVGPAITRGAASYNGRGAVLISVVKQPDAGTMATTERLDGLLAELRPTLEARGVEVHGDVFRQQDFIDMAIANLVEVLRDGAVLVVVVLFLFLWSLRPTLISVMAIPLSLLAATSVLDLLGMSIDTMTLGGLAIAIGELVDDAIVDVENVSRRLRERLTLPEAERAGVLETVLSGSMEIRSSIVSATWILMLVFVPLLMLGGLEGRLLRPLAIAYLVAIFASLVVAVTVTPVLCSLLLRPSAERAERGPPLIRWLVEGYRPLLRGVLQRPLLVLGLAAVVVVAGVVRLSNLDRSFLPEFNEGSLTIAMVLQPGTPLSDSDQLATLAEQALLEDPAVAAVGRRTGRAERDEHVLGVETSELEVRMRPDARNKGQLFADIRERLRVVPGAHFTLGQPLSHRIEHMVSGQRTALSIKVFGEDLGELRQVAGRVEAVARQTSGLIDVSVEQVVDIPQLVTEVDPQRASLYGMSAGEAAAAIGTALWGATAGQVYEQGTTTDVVVRYPDTARRDLDTLRRLPVVSSSGALVPVAALAHIRHDAGPNYILRENVRRRVVVTANVAGGGGVDRAYRSLQARVGSEVRLPPGVHIEYAGTFEREEATRKRLWLFGALAVLGIALIVLATLGSARRTLIVLANLPLALTGGIIGVELGGSVMSVATTIGFITLFGIASRNGILLATRVRDLE